MYIAQYTMWVVNAARSNVITQVGRFGGVKPSKNLFFARGVRAEGAPPERKNIGFRASPLEDIDMEAVERYLAYRAERSRQRRRYRSATELLLGLEAAVMDSQTGMARPTNAGLLMFGYDPQLLLPQSEVVCIKYADTVGVRQYIERKNFLGTLPELIDKTSSFLRQYIRVGATIRGLYRKDEPEYPYEA